MLNDQNSSASQNTTLTSSTFDATAKDTLGATTADPGTTEVVQLNNKNMSAETENENHSSIANEKSVNSSKRNIDVVTVEQKPPDASTQEILNASCSNKKEDILRQLISEEEQAFEQQLTDVDYQLQYVPPLALKRKKIFSSFNKAQTSRRNFIKENIRHLREMQFRLNEKRSHTTPATLLQSRDQKAASKKLPQFPMLQTSQKHFNRDNKTPRRKIKNKITRQQKMYLRKATRSHLQKSGEHGSIARDQTSSTTSLTSVHDSGCSSASDETLRNFYAETNNDREMYHMSSSDDKENILSPDGNESINSIKNYSDAKMMKQNILAPDSQDALNAYSPQQRKALADSLNVKMTAKAMAAMKKVLAPSPPNPLKAPPSYQKGVLPKYLLSRQEQQQKEECDRQLRDPDCPPGYVRLPDMERRETLSILRKYYGDLIQAMNTLPVQTTAKKIQQKKMDIEKQLDKLQAAIKVFSKPKVFMKVGS
ncbi:probable basic-leucine zipper transcription factor R [Schistocerca cancellata]|uniref:probable basic-leucine zipper transcription factor R n=1 Tax=Schistocerca cancellata TaxID=274614 RepID=UPI00211877EB|nr:probable basic-leucine zipper transcription factor R [Schistocerca cancellata]